MSSAKIPEDLQGLYADAGSFRHTAATGNNGIRRLIERIATLEAQNKALQDALATCVEEVVAQASLCMSHVGVMPRQQDWVRNEMRVYGTALVARATLAATKEAA